MSEKLEYVSVIVPVYNAGLYLERCIDSILEQTYPYIELILVDDGSIDESKSICDAYQKNHKNIRTVHIEHHGVTYARLTGCEKAAGKYIAFVDADDWIERDYIEGMVLEINNGDIVLNGICKEKEGRTQREIFERNQFPEGRYCSERDRRSIYEKMLYYAPPFVFGVLQYMCNKLFRRELIYPLLSRLDQRIYDGEDVALIYPYLLMSKSIYVSNKCRYHYCIYPGSASLRKKKDGYLNAVYLYQSLYRDFNKSMYAETLMPQLEQYMRFLIWKEDPAEYIKINSFYFPYQKVRPGADIILYGAGKAGHILYHEIFVSKYCNVIAWADAKYKEGTVEVIEQDDEKKQVPRIAPDEISQFEYDHIVIAIQDGMMAKNIIETMKKQGVDENKMITL